MSDRRALPISICLLLAVLVAGCGQAQPTGTPVPSPVPTSIPAPASAPTQAPVPPTPTKAPAAAHHPLLMAHYMPWYQTKAARGFWGWHWTMDHFNPDEKDANGQPAIASHYHPLTGPYDSSDDALLEYQVMLMKLSGIDGVIVDWYGFENYMDYGMLNDSTRKLFEHVKKAGLLFAICYEDTTIRNMLDKGHVQASDVFTYGQKVMTYLQSTWFKDDTYLKASGRPLLLVFGNPPYFKASSDWETLFSVLEPKPVLVTEDNPVLPVAAAAYPWPPMSLSGGGELTPDRLDSYLTNFYQQAQSWNYRIAGAFPGFHDIYKEAGVGSGYGFLDARNGATFSSTLQAALKSQPDVVQLVTWNDFGEGTNIEPAVEYGYQYLQIVQETRRASIDKAFPYTADDLTLPLQIFKQRQQHKDDASVNARLDKAVDAVLAGQLDAAKALLAQGS